MSRSLLRVRAIGVGTNVQKCPQKLLLFPVKSVDGNVQVAGRSKVEREGANPAFYDGRRSGHGPSTSQPPQKAVRSTFATQNFSGCQRTGAQKRAERAAPVLKSSVARTFHGTIGAILDFQRSPVPEHVRRVPSIKEH